MTDGTRIQTRIVIAAATVIAFTAALWAPQVLNDGDSWWHVVAGRLMIARHGLINTDPFSYTFAGRPWLNHEWLADALFGGAFNLAGWSGVMLLTACAAGLAAWLLARDVARWLCGLPLIIVLGVALSLVGPHLLARPHLLALPLLEIWTVGMVLARARGRGPAWALLPAMTLWANLHGSFFFGLGLTGVFGLEALIAAPAGQRIGVALRWGGFGVAAAGAALLTPHGIDGLLLPLRLSGMASLAHIGEWAPADFSTVSPLEIALLAALYGFLSRPVRLPPLRALLMLLLVFLALRHVRHEMLLAIVAPLLLALPLAEAYGHAPRTGDTAAPLPPRLPSPWLAGLAVIVLALACARLFAPVMRTDGPAAPISAMAAVPATLAAQPVLNDYAFGGYLIFRGVKPFIDSRADLYGDRFVLAYSRLAAGDAAALGKVLEDRRVRWTILAPATPLSAAMRAMPGWRLLHADRFAEVEVRASP
ncbi:MAG TPA: hypothetical protein VII73_13500 [Caulobacteraceae bacterium]